MKNTTAGFHSAFWSVAVVAGLGCAGSGATGGGPAATADVAPVDPVVTYQPAQASYYGTTRGHVEQEVNGQVTKNDFRLRYALTVQVDSADTSLAATMTIDSVPEISGAGFAPEQADQLKGASFTATLLPTGELAGFPEKATTAGGQLGDMVTRMLQEFFPKLPEGGAKPGIRWEDTLEASSSVGGVDITRKSVRQHEIVEWTTHAGQRALHIVTLSTYDLTGVGSQFGQDFTLSGQGRQHVHQYLGEHGRYLGRIMADTSDSMVDVDVGITIPIRQTRTDTLSIIS